MAHEGWQCAAVLAEHCVTPDPRRDSTSLVPPPPPPPPCESLPHLWQHLGGGLLEHALRGVEVVHARLHAEVGQHAGGGLLHLHQQQQ
jgi:hypothetical protein